MNGSVDPGASEVSLNVGGNTDVGQIREQNQDSILLGPVLFAVADGMGGHQGGEVASALAVETIITELARLGPDDTPTTGDLQAAVIQANRSVYDRSAHDPSVAGMGTTLVGLALVTDSDRQSMAVVNVGDSRAYRYRRGQLTQVTEDHSLVGELMRDGQITAEEAEVHPRRNIVTRVLGVERDVRVDAFHFPASGGDRFLLCSDGLTNEVPEVEIAAVLRNIVDPDDAAAELVRQANDNGGRDNITVVVVDISGPEVEDGAVPDADDFSHAGEDTASYAPIGAGPGASPAPDGDPGDSDGHRRPPRTKQRAITLRSIAFVVLVLALLGGGVYLINDYATNTYHVTIDDGRVAIFKGRAGGFLWVEAKLVERTDLEAQDVLPADLASLEDGIAQPSLKRAQRYVENLRDRIAETTPPVTTTTQVTTTTAKPKTPADAATTTGG